jgi:uncharacterized protein YdaU (DUF1376 family)
VTKERKLEYFAWYAAAYRADTAHLTREESYAFREIIDEIFITAQDTCRIVDDDLYLRRLCKASAEEWKEIRWTLIDGPRALLKKRGRSISSPKLTEEIEKARVKSRQAREAVGRRERIKRSADDDRTINGRSSDDAQAINGRSSGDEEAINGRLSDDQPTINGRSSNKSKKKPSVSKSKNSSPTGELSAPRLRAELGALKIKLGKTAETLIPKWLAKHSEADLAAAVLANSDRIAAASHPLQYLAAIIRGLGSTASPEGPREGFYATSLTPREWAAQYPGRPYGMSYEHWQEQLREQLDKADAAQAVS